MRFEFYNFWEDIETERDIKIFTICLDGGIGFIILNFGFGIEF